MGWTTEIRFPAGEGNDLLFAMASRLIVRHTRLSIQWVPGPFPGIKAAGA
jgi:hypothetical protein